MAMTPIRKKVKVVKKASKKVRPKAKKRPAVAKRGKR